ncbi:hypothetical protein MASR2M18_20310 [Ignavibacteria bacterium]|nr:DUF177 domain-containing protein [Bacteroidota bacterium]MCZ2131819.1 DUF177 domain-containing protein [Bacteroidota bacterium]
MPDFAVLKLAVRNLEDGESEFEIESPVHDVENIASEFCGTVSVKGVINKNGSRYAVQGIASSVACLICDLSLEEFIEKIEAPIALIVIAGAESGTGDAFVAIREDDKYIDLTEEVRQELAVRLPMKAISPKYREMTFEELRPGFSADRAENEAKDTWAALRNIKFNSHN